MQGVLRPILCENTPKYRKEPRPHIGNVIKFTNNDMPLTQSGSILKKVESDFFLRFRNNYLCTVPAHSKAMDSLRTGILRSYIRFLTDG